MGNNNNGSATLWPDSATAKSVRDKLSDDRTLQAIDHLLMRIDTLEQAVENLATLLRQGPGLVAMAGDILDETYRQADAQGVSIDQRLKNSVLLAERLTASETVAKLDSLLQLSDQLPGIVAMAVDTVDEGMKQAVEKGFDPQTLMDTAVAANSALTLASLEPPAKVGGIFGLLRVLKDPDRQRGLGFMMNFLKYFGRQI